MKKLFTLVLLLCSITGFVIAQGDYRPGYVLLNSGDTLRGEIVMRTDFNMSKECLFRYAKGSEVQTLMPDAVKEFRFDDGRYWISETVEGRGQMFLEYLVEGILNVYHSVDKEGDHFFLKKEGSPISEINMPRKNAIVYVGDKDYMVPPDQLRDYLQSLTVDAPQLSKRIQSTNEFEQKEFVKLAVDYHNAVCTDRACLVYSKQMHGVIVSLQPFVGITRHVSLKVNYPEFGTYVNFWLPLENEKMYLKTGVIYGQVPVEEAEGTYRADLVKVPLQVRFLSAPRTVRAEISLGPEFAFVQVDKVSGYTHLFNINSAADIDLTGKDKTYLTLGLSATTTPLIGIGTNEGVRLFSFSAFGGFYFIF